MGDIRLWQVFVEKIFEYRIILPGRSEFAADWIRYDHKGGVLFTDSPVLITDSAGTFRGGGFRYIVAERRFKLLGGASVVQQN